MTEQRKRLERALRGCAEHGISDGIDLWSEIRQRVSGERMAGARAGGERPVAGSRRRVWSPRLVPDHPFGWLLAVISVLIIGMGAYVASGPVRELMGYGLPGPGAPGPGETTNSGQPDGGSGVAYSLFRSYVPGGGGEEIGQSRIADGAKVILRWAYADANSVVVGYTVEDLTGGRRVGEHPAELQPTDRVQLTDQSGTEFKRVAGAGALSPGPNNITEGPKANSAVFEAAQRVEPGGEHRFRLEIPLQERPVTPLGEGGETPQPQPVGEPFVFDFEIPVRPTPVVEVNKKDTASGITLTLERVTDSQGRPKAVVCLGLPDGARGWYPSGEDLSSEAPSQVAGEGSCLQMLLNDPLAGPSSVTIGQIEFNPASDGELTRGPWRFDFEVPETSGP